MVKDEKYDFLEFVDFVKLGNWDYKSYLKNEVFSKYEIVLLGTVLEHQNKKEMLNLLPEKEFGILGISNEIGMFDAYIEKGKNIKQPYKVVKDGFIAYNPYRINVGSMGIKTSDIKNTYISSAYVVFSCKKKIMPEYLYLLMKTDYFNKQVIDNTTGSVRQTLSFENLSKIRIPLPSLKMQEKIINQYNEKIIQAGEKEKQAKQIENKIEEYLFKELGIKQTIQKETSKEQYEILRFYAFSNLKKWNITNNKSVNTENILKSTIYKNVSISSVAQINPTTKIPTNIEKVSFVPMDSVSKVYGEIEKQLEKNISQCRGFTKFTENDILWAKITPCMQNGKCCIAQNLKNGFGIGSTEFHVIRCDKSNILTEYVYILLRTNIVRNVAMQYFSGSAGQQRVPKSYIENLVIPFPPIEIQNKIAYEIIRKKEKIKSLENNIEKLRKTAKQILENEIFDNN